MFLFILIFLLLIFGTSLINSLCSVFWCLLVLFFLLVNILVTMDYLKYMDKPSRGWGEPYLQYMGRFRSYSNA